MDVEIAWQDLPGAPIIKQGMVERDFVELATADVRLLGEIGLSSVKTGAEACRRRWWRGRAGRAFSPPSTPGAGGRGEGGASIPGAGLMDAQALLEADGPAGSSV